MSRYAMTILTIAAIILAAADSAGAAPPEEPKELTVLTYNTHLFYNSALHVMCDLCDNVPFICNCDSSKFILPPQYYG